MASDLPAVHDDGEYSWFRDAATLGWKLAAAVFQEWRPLTDARESSVEAEDRLKLRLESQQRLFDDLASQLCEDHTQDLEDMGASISVDVAFLACCNAPLKIAMAWAEANEAEGFYPDRAAAREIVNRTWSDHVRLCRDDHERFASNLGRLLRISWAYEHRLVAASVLGEQLQDPENPLPDQPGMKSAFAIAAALSPGTRGYGGTVGEAGMEKWLKRFRQARAESRAQDDRLFLRFNETTVQLELAADPIGAALDKLPHARGKPRKGPN